MLKFKKDLIDSLVGFIEKYYFVFIILILGIASFNMLYKISNFPIADWDEARHGINAYEMIRNKNYIVNTYGGANDYWNLKPPMSFWMIIIGYKLFGFSAFAMRAYSSLFSILTILILAVYVKHRHGRLASLISASVMTTTTQFIISHCARTGDADALFLFFFTAAVLCIFLSNENIRFLYLGGLAFSFAFLTKSWHAGAIVMIGGLYILLSGLYKKLSSKQWLILILCSTLPVILWAAFRYANDGLQFFIGMIKYDLLKRSSTPLEGHTGDGWYYLNDLRDFYLYWLYVLVGSFFGYLALMEKTNRDKKNYIVGMVLWVALPFAIFTKASTKIPWYIIPIYPAFAVCIGAFCSRLLKIEKSKQALKLALAALILFSLYYNELGIIKEIKAVPVSNIQNALKVINRNDIYKEANAYNEVSGGQWDQSTFLAAQLYGDLVPRQGGLEEFFKDDTANCVVITKKDTKYKDIINEKNLKIISENSDFYILTK